MSSDKSGLVLEELARLREEVVGTRNLTIKTDNLIKHLQTDVQAVSTRMGQSRRRAILNSVFTYLIFVVLIFTGLYLTFDARLAKHAADKELFAKKENTYKRDLIELQAQLGRWKQIERELLEFERLVRDGNKEQAVAKFSSLRSVRFSGLLKDLISRFKAEVAEDKYDRGKELFDQGNFDKADEAFLKSLEYNESPKYIGKLMYYQGMSALRLKDFERAANLLRKGIGHKLERRDLADASYHLAYAHDRMGEKRTARDLYHRFFNRHAKHGFAPRAKRRYFQLKGTRAP